MTELLNRFPDMSDEHLTDEQIAHIGQMPEAASAAQSVSEFHERVEEFEEQHEKFESAKEAAEWVENIYSALLYELPATVNLQGDQLIPQEDENIAKQAQQLYAQGMYITKRNRRNMEGGEGLPAREQGLYFKDSVGGIYHIEPDFESDGTTGVEYTSNPDTKYAYTEEVFTRKAYEKTLVTRKVKSDQVYGRRLRNELFAKDDQPWDEIQNGPGSEVDTEEAEALEQHYMEFVGSARAALETVLATVGNGDSFVEHKIELNQYKKEEEARLRLEDMRARKTGKSFLKRVMRRHN